MLSVLNNRTYRHLFTAQVIALVGTGLMTVALGLLAYELAGADAGAVLGTALAIKMLAYAGVAPVAQAFADRLPRRSLLVALDLVRAAVALCLPFVTEVWQGTPHGYADAAKLIGKRCLIYSGGRFDSVAIEPEDGEHWGSVIWCEYV